MIKIIIGIIAFIGVLGYLLILGSEKLESQLDVKMEMCYDLQDVCDHECDTCAWNWRKEK